MNSSARLIVQIGAQPQRSYPINSDITIVGREAINDLVVNDAEVSRRHTRVTRQAEGYLVDDLGSTNGTFVNGKRVTVPTLLYHGDVVDMGKSVHLIFELDEPYEQATRPIQMEPESGYQADELPDVEPPEEFRDPSPYAPEYKPERPAAAPSRPQFAATPPPPSAPRPAQPVYEEAFEEYEEADSAEFYRPPAAPVMVDGEKFETSDDVEETGGCQRYFVTFGCLSLLFVVLLLASLFILDNVAPEFLYCGPLQGLWETILGPALRATGRVWVCP